MTSAFAELDVGVAWNDSDEDDVEEVAGVLGVMELEIDAALLVEWTRADSGDDELDGCANLQISLN